MPSNFPAQLRALRRDLTALVRKVEARAVAGLAEHDEDIEALRERLARAEARIDDLDGLVQQRKGP